MNQNENQNKNKIQVINLVVDCKIMIEIRPKQLTQCTVQCIVPSSDPQAKLTQQWLDMLNWEPVCRKNETIQQIQ